MSEFDIDLEGANRFFAGSAAALQHADALEGLHDMPQEEAKEHIAGLLNALGSFSKSDVLSGLGVAALALEAADHPQLTLFEE